MKHWLKIMIAFMLFNWIVLSYDNVWASWSRIYLGEYSGRLVDVWGTSKDNVYIIGIGGILIHLSSNKWEVFQEITGKKFNKILGLTRQGLVISTNNGNIIFDGDQFIDIPNEVMRGAESIYCGSSAFTIGLYDIQCEDLETTADVIGIPDTYIASIWTDGSMLAAVGSMYPGFAAEFIIPCDSCSTYTTDTMKGFGETFHSFGLLDSGYQHGIISTGYRNVWGVSSSDIFAVGYNKSSDIWYQNNRGIFTHYTGEEWQDIPVPESTSPLSQVHGCSSDFVIAVGEDGTILFYDGMELSKMDSGTSVNLNAVWVASRNLAFAVGDDFTILRYWNDRRRRTRQTSEEGFIE